MTSQQKCVHQHRVQSHHRYDKQKTFCSFLAKLLLGDKMFGKKGDGFPDIAETPFTDRFTCSRDLPLLSGKTFQLSSQTVRQTALRTSLHRCLHFTTVRVGQNNVWRQRALWPSFCPLLPNKTWPMWSCSKKTHAWDKRQFESFAGKHGSDPPSSSGCTEALCPLGAPPDDRETEKFVGRNGPDPRAFW